MVFEWLRAWRVGVGRAVGLALRSSKPVAKRRARALAPKEATCVQEVAKDGRRSDESRSRRALASTTLDMPTFFEVSNAVSPAPRRRKCREGTSLSRAPFA